MNHLYQTAPHPCVNDFINQTKGSNAMILEIGAEYGNSADQFIKHNYSKIILNDSNDQKIKYMQNKFKTNKNVAFNKSKTAHKIAMKTESVTGIYCTNVIHFLNKTNIKQFLNNCFMILKPGGIIGIGAVSIFAHKKMLKHVGIKSSFDIKSISDILDENNFLPLSIELCKCAYSKSHQIFNDNNYDNNVFIIAKKMEIF